MKKASGIVLIALPIISVAIYAFSGEVLWVDASKAPGRQFLIGFMHWLSLCVGLAVLVESRFAGK
jgi:hypothetical protein